MTNYDTLEKEILGRGDKVAPPLPGACWTNVQGNFTPTELRAIADEIDRKFAEAFKSNVDKN